MTFWDIVAIPFALIHLAFTAVVFYLIFDFIKRHREDIIDFIISLFKGIKEIWKEFK